MLAVFIILLILFAAGAFAFLRRNRNSLSESKEDILLAPTNFAGLFDHHNSGQFATAEKETLEAKRHTDLLERAKQFDLQALDEAQTDAKFYPEILAELITQSLDSQDRLQALVGHLSQSKELRSNVRLAEIMIEAWKNSPNNKTTARMLHIVALSDDASLLQRAIELTFDSWKKGLLPKLSAKDFLAVAESEYWVLAPEARRSGTGFILKNSLAELRRTLAAARRG
jgi:hypothetical protein